AIIAKRFWQSVAVFSIVGGIILIAVLVNIQPPTPKKIVESENKGAQIRQTAKVEIPEIKFTDITESAGITFKHDNGAEGEKLLPETMGAGSAFFDYDNDGDQDLLFVNGMSWPWAKQPAEPPSTMELYQNDGTGKFKNVTADVGLAVPMYGMGIACGDYNGDGWTDLYLTTVGKNRWFRNEQGKFVEAT
ncbi:VCBS repeat-containing protein, partial [bacterium]|nr:VCBS repeat-containing protein [bacterium]